MNKTKAQNRAIKDLGKWATTTDFTRVRPSPAKTLNDYILIYNSVSSDMEAVGSEVFVVVMPIIIVFALVAYTSRNRVSQFLRKAQVYVFG